MALASGHEHGPQVNTKGGTFFLEWPLDRLICHSHHGKLLEKRLKVNRMFNKILLVAAILLSFLVFVGILVPIFHERAADVGFGSVFRRQQPFRTSEIITESIAVLMDDPPAHYQEDMLDAVRTAMKWMSTQQTKLGVSLNITLLKVIPAANNSQALQSIQNLKKDFNMKTFIDLRMDRFSGDLLTSILFEGSSDENNSTGEAGSRKKAEKAIVYPTFVLSYPKTRDESAMKTGVISISGTIEAQVVAILSKMADAGSKFVAPVVDTASDRQEQALKIFKKQSHLFGVDVFPAVEYNSTLFNDESPSDSKMASRRVILQLEPILRRFPAVSIIVFGGKEVVKLLEEVSDVNEKNMRNKSSSSETVDNEASLESSKRPWYFPDAVHWEAELKANEKAFQMGKNVGLFSVGFLGQQDYSTNFRRRRMMEIAGQSGRPAHIHSAMAFDSALIAMNSILQLHGINESDLFSQGTTGSFNFDSAGHRQGPLTFARLMLTPTMIRRETTGVEVLQNSPWLLDGVVQVLEILNENGTTASVTKVDGVGSSHVITKNHFDLIRKWGKTKCKEPKIAVTTFDPLNYERIERSYNVSNFPEGLVMPDDHGYAVEIRCKAAAGSNATSQDENTSSNTGDEVEAATGSSNFSDESSSTSSTEMIVNFVCPSKDPLVRLPCVHSSTTLIKHAEGENVVRKRRSPDNRWTPVEDDESSVASRNLAEIPREHAQRYFDVMSRTDSTSGIKLADLEGWSGVDPWWEDPVDRERREDAGASREQEDHDSAFQKRKSSVPGGYEAKEESNGRRKKFQDWGHHGSQSGNGGTDQPWGQGGHGGHGGQQRPTTRIRPPFGHTKGNSTGVSPTENVWSPKLIAELSESFGLPESEVQHILKASQGSFMPSIMRKDVVAAPPPPPTTPKPKYPVPPYAKMIVNALPSMGGCSGAGTTCVVCAMVTEGSGSTSIPCIGTCNASIWSNCMGMMGLIFTKVFKDNSVICSELFRQGKLDLPTYLADSQFGARLRATNPDAMRGYHFMAKPVVWAMKRSSKVSSVVEICTRPWVKQMAFEEGYATEGDFMGAAMMKYGVPFSAGVGKIVGFVQNHFTTQLSVGLLSLVALNFVK